MDNQGTQYADQHNPLNLEMMDVDEDWEICNADPHRVTEFLSAINDENVIMAYAGYNLDELVVESLDMALWDSIDINLSSDQLRAVLKMLKDDSELMKYYRSRKVVPYLMNKLG